MSGFPARRRRSALYLPASNSRAVDKARSLDCDVVILDLEDAVAPENKSDARARACAAVAAGGYGERELVIRVNEIGSLLGDADLVAVLAARPDAVLLPKIESADQILAVARHVAGTGVALWAMVETAAAVMELNAIARCGRDTPLAALVLGSNDLLKELGVPRGGGRLPLDLARGLTVLAGRAHGVDVLDGVFNALDDAQGLEEACRQAAEDGFSGKTLIHPNQIAACNLAFRPSETELDWARGVVAAFALPENQALAAIRHDGAMVERLHLEVAQRVLSRVAR